MLQNGNSVFKKDFLIKVNKTFSKIKQKDVYYFQSDGSYVSIFLESREYSIRTSLKSLMPMLSKNFVRIHSSYIVNSEKIKNIQVQPNLLTLDNGVELHFGRTFKVDLFSRFIVG